MIGHILKQESDIKLILLKLGDRYLSHAISEEPVFHNNCIEQVITNNGSMYLGRSLTFGPVAPNEPVAILLDPEEVTLSLLADHNVLMFLQQIVHEWATGNIPSWLNQPIVDDLYNFVKWYVGEVQSLTRSPEAPC